MKAIYFINLTHNCTIVCKTMLSIDIMATQWLVLIVIKVRVHWSAHLNIFSNACSMKQSCNGDSVQLFECVISNL